MNTSNLSLDSCLVKWREKIPSKYDRQAGLINRLNKVISSNEISDQAYLEFKGNTYNSQQATLIGFVRKLVLIHPILIL